MTLSGKLVVEVDGVTHDTPTEIEKDDTRTRALEAFGFHVIRVSNTDVYENLEGVVEFIHRELKL